MVEELRHENIGKLSEDFMLHQLFSHKNVNDNTNIHHINNICIGTAGTKEHDINSNDIENLNESEIIEMSEDKNSKTFCYLKNYINVDFFGLDNDQEHESYLRLCTQIFIPFSFCGFGMVCAGLIFDTVQHYEVFLEVKEIMPLIPALLGLKGNLEMTLASRLSTQANLGHFDNLREFLHLSLKNLALIEFQAIVSGIIATIAVTIIALIRKEPIKVSNILLLCASSLITITSATFLLSILTIVVIYISRKLNWNPDNLSTPIASSIGDLSAIFILSRVAAYLYKRTGEYLSLTIIMIYIILALILGCFVLTNLKMRKTLKQSCLPILSAMVINLFGGCILDYVIVKFRSIAVFQPVMNGVGGNLVSVQASRISTSLHQFGEKIKELLKSSVTEPLTSDSLSVLDGEKPRYIKYSKTPWGAFFGKDTHSRTARVLMSLVIPGHLIFILAICLIKLDTSVLTLQFVTLYLAAALIQVGLLLYFAKIMITWMWNREIDPDNSAIPFLTAIGDFLGISLLAFVFLFLKSFGLTSF